MTIRTHFGIEFVYITRSFSHDFGRKNTGNSRAFWSLDYQLTQSTSWASLTRRVIWLEGSAGCQTSSLVNPSIPRGVIEMDLWRMNDVIHGLIVLDGKTHLVGRHLPNTRSRRSVGNTCRPSDRNYRKGVPFTQREPDRPYAVDLETRIRRIPHSISS